ncbi:MAG: pyridine nucleotide-disulfide oxidoreductase, partial [Elusimicrobia bacterium]|nr:pyridine nucleotide-disulfide oxidoreductase [Elusimicrobiota bacterium]MBD3412607.1 pyridine nucleotide-disulfide oxidoreductase [Elusimicrobiota bacterium]
YMLSRFPSAVQQKALHILRSYGIAVIQNARIQTVHESHVQLSQKSSLPYDLMVITTGTIPASLYQKSNLPTGPDGGLLVNTFLQSVNYPNIFGAGDCISFKPQAIDRVGVFAIRQGPILMHNLMAYIKKQPLKPFRPQKLYLSILNMGNKKGIAYRRPFMINGQLAFLLKNYLDNSFMKKYQLCGERNECF